jgi:hypothetical protein
MLKTNCLLDLMGRRENWNPNLEYAQCCSVLNWAAFILHLLDRKRGDQVKLRDDLAAIHFGGLN